MSSPVLKPISDCLPLISFYNNKVYVIPPFQRGYAWKQDQIDEMLSDMIEFLDSNDPVYLMGQVIVTHAKTDGHYYLIDGQQRITSLLLLLLAIERKFSGIPQLTNNPELNYKFSQLTQLTRTYVSGSLIPRIIAEEANDYNEFVGGLVRNATTHAVSSWTQENLSNAYRRIVDFIDINWPNPEDIQYMYERIVQGVHLVRLELPTQEEAEKVFERINNRGLALSSADLVKNLVFEIVQEEVLRDSLSIDWDRTARILYMCKNNRIRSIEYLLRSIIIFKKGELVSSFAMRDVWKSYLNRNIGETISTVKMLPEKAGQLLNLSVGKTPQGQNTEHNQSGKYFGTIQHFPILLAGAHINQHAYQMLSHIIEDRTIVSLLAKERPQNFEKIVPKLGFLINNMPSTITPEDLRNKIAEVDSEWNDLLRVAFTNFTLLRTQKSTDKKKIRYFLARISRKVQFDAKTPAVPDLNLMLATNKGTSNVDVVGYDIEHIYPLSLGGDMPIYDSIGNLVLAHPKDQRDAQNKLPQDKMHVYLSSNLLLTQSLCNETELRNTLSIREKEELRQIQAIATPNLETWNETTINHRISLYWYKFMQDLAIKPTSSTWQRFMDNPTQKM